MVLKNPEVITSRKRVAGRETILKAIFDFVKSVVIEHGVVTRADERGGDIHVVFELNNFNGLYFALSIGNESMEGDNIQISYSPSQNRRYLVFSTNYPKGGGEYRVHFFSEEVDWQEAFACAVEHAGKILVKWHAEWPKDWHAAESRRNRKKEAIRLIEKVKTPGLA